MMEQQPPGPNDGMFPPAGGPGPPHPGMDGPHGHAGMMDHPSMDPMGQQPPMDHMGGPMDNMGMNGGVPPGMDPMGMDPMGMDPMGNNGPDAMMGPPYFESSEYLMGKAKTTSSTGHDGTATTTTGVVIGLSGGRAGHGVSRQNSSASMELDSVSVKKIEEAEDDYSKVKQALLSDLGTDPEDLCIPAEAILSPLMPSVLEAEAESEAAAARPEFDPFTPSVPLPQFLATTSSDSRLASSSASSGNRHRSKDTLESIFGGQSMLLSKGSRSAAEPAGLNNYSVELLVPTTTTTKAESRSSYFSTSDNSSRSLLEAEMHESHFNLEEHQSSSFINNHSNHSSTTTKANSSSSSNLLLVTPEEPFPICLSPELEEMMTLHQQQPPLPKLANRSVQPMIGHLSSPRTNEVYTIPEVSEEESSPTTGDAVTKAASKGTFIPDTSKPMILIYQFMFFFCLYYSILITILIVQPNLCGGQTFRLAKVFGMSSKPDLYSKNLQLIDLFRFPRCFPLLLNQENSESY